VNREQGVVVEALTSVVTIPKEGQRHTEGCKENPDTERLAVHESLECRIWILDCRVVCDEDDQPRYVEEAAPFDHLSLRYPTISRCGALDQNSDAQGPYVKCLFQRPL